MQFVIIGLDGTDKEAHTRRQAVRHDHIAMGDKLLESGNLWYGAALLNDDGSTKGSMYVVSFPSEKELQEWLDKEPYIVGGVWRHITIHKSNTRDPWQFNRPQEWFEKNT
ncbi:MAG TPA: YciI family protein [Candidatus Saccharimonadia bacterium]